MIKRLLPLVAVTCLVFGIVVPSAIAMPAVQSSTDFDQENLSAGSEVNTCEFGIPLPIAGGDNRNKGGQGRDYRNGGKFRDFLRGSKGDDTLRGQKGKNMLWGDRGNDIIIAGPDKDMIVYKKLNEGTDTIKRFNQNEDVIDLREIFDRDGFAGDNNCSRFDEFVDLNVVNGNTEVRVDRDGYGSGTKLITFAVVEGVSDLDNTNFVIN